MTREQAIQYAPLILAAFGVVSTLLFISCASRPSVVPSRFWLINTLWYVLTFGAGAVFVFWYALAVIRGDDAFSRLLTLLFLGVMAPIYGTFGLVAYGWPNFWQRFIALRDASQQQYRNRVRRVVGTPPDV